MDNLQSMIINLSNRIDILEKRMENFENMLLISNHKVLCTDESSESSVNKELEESMGSVSDSYLYLSTSKSKLIQSVFNYSTDDIEKSPPSKLQKTLKELEDESF